MRFKLVKIKFMAEFFYEYCILLIKQTNVFKGHKRNIAYNI